MSDTYCPPPDPSDYLESGIEYPVPSSKELKRSLSPTHNDINFEEPVVGKQQTTSLSIEERISNIQLGKSNTEISTSTQQPVAKSQQSVSAAGRVNVKSGRTVFPSYTNISRKAVNEI